MAGDIPSGEQSVFHFLDIFALGCGLEACTAAFRQQWGLAVVGVMGAVVFHLFGTKWAIIQSHLWPRLSARIEVIARNPRRRFIARLVSVLSVVGYFALTMVLYLNRLHMAAAQVPSPITWPHLAPPEAGIYLRRKPAIEKPAAMAPPRKLTDDEIAMGAEPAGPPHPDVSDPSLGEEQRLNEMSVAQLQEHLAGTIRKLKEFDEKWHYPEWRGPSEPVPDDSGRVPPEKMKEYWKRYEAWRETIFEVRPKKRAQAFKDAFPQIGTLVGYLHNRWPDIQEGDDCFVQDKMIENAALGCAGYIQAVLDKSRRQ
jgi:hypothetical protein